MTTLLPIVNFDELADFFTNHDFNNINFYFVDQKDFVVTKNDENLTLLVNLGFQYLSQFENSMFNHAQNLITIQDHFKSPDPHSILFLNFKKNNTVNLNANNNDFLKQFLNYFTSDALFYLKIAKQKYAKKSQKQAYYHLKSHTLFVAEMDYDLILNLRKTIYEAKIAHRDDMPVTLPTIVNKASDVFNNPNLIGSEPIFHHHYQALPKNDMKMILASIPKQKLTTLKIIPFKDEDKLDQFGQPPKTNYSSRYNQIIYLPADLGRERCLIYQESNQF